MPKGFSGSTGGVPGLDQISTRWAILKDPVQFLLRYGPAIRKYLQALLKNPDDVDEIAQDILTKVVQNAFGRASPDHGRFRDYLKVAVRNAALMHLRKKKAVQPAESVLLQIADPLQTALVADQEWLADWQRCIMNKAWRALDSHERRTPDNHFYTVLKLSVDHPNEDSTRLAERASRKIGKPLRADAFRKQVSRARRMFAELLLDEVVNTLDQPSPQQIEEELIAIGLMDYVRDFLPPDWQTRAKDGSRR